MTWRRHLLGVLPLAVLLAATQGEPVSADERPETKKPSRRLLRDRFSHLQEAEVSQKRSESLRRPEFGSPESLLDSSEPTLTNDDELAGWTDGLNGRLIGYDAGSAPIPPQPSDDAGDEVEFDPWHGDFQRILPGDEQPYWILPEDDEPLGWVGRQTERPVDLSGSDFFPVPDRWRQGFPQWGRYRKGSPLDPFNSNVLKGDYPLVVGDDKFLELTVVSDTNAQVRRRTVNVTGTDEDVQTRQRIFITTDYFQNDNTFTPSPWFIRITQAADLRDQTDQGYNDDYAWQEAFIDWQLGIISEYYDQVNWRLGRQGFQSDFRGFLYSDVNNMSRVFGTWDENKWQYNFIVMDAIQQDPISQFLRSTESRQQQMVGGNVFRRDVPWLGFNIMGAGFYVHDNFKRTVDAAYLEFAAEGVIGPYGVSGAFIQALGRDEANPFAKRAVNVNAQFAALEITRPTNWVTPRFAALYASGDANPTNGTGRGFDAIFDNPNFSAANFAFFNRETLNTRKLTLVNNNSFLPNLRTKAFDPMNFVNPGIFILTSGLDTVVTTKVNAFVNYNAYWFVEPAAIEQAVAVKNGGLKLAVDRAIGQDITLGFQYRPLIINNMVLTFGSTAFYQGAGMQTLSDTDRTLYTTFANAVFVY